MQYSLLTYNTFATSTLLYVPQLENVPEEVSKEECKQVVRMFPGPGHWIEPCDAWYLKENFGLAKSAQSLSLMACAAKLRVASLGCHFGIKCVNAHNLRRLGRDNIFSRAHDIHNACLL